MDATIEQDIRAILAAGQDLTLATLRPDGWPQATTLSYASDGLDIYVGCSAKSQKAANMTRDDRVSATIGLPYGHWNEIRGLSLGGRARRLTDPADMARAGKLFLDKFGAEIGQYMSGDASDLALFQIAPEVISVLDYRKGFGHTEQVRPGAPAD